jgi:putative peptidoglycan lipid II flippase
MVKRFFQFIQKEISGLHQAAYLLAFFALFSQVLGLLRDRLLASSFGASGTLDVYYAAFRIPDFIFISVGSMVSVAVLIPFMMDKMKAGSDEGRKFLSNVFSFFFLLIVVVCFIAFFLIPRLSAAIFPGFSGEKLQQVVMLTRIILLSPILLGLSNLLGTLTQMYQRFFLYSLSPIVYNLGIIVGVLFLYPLFGLVGLAYGVIIGAFLHFAIQVPFIIEHGLFPRLQFKFNMKEIKRVFTVSLPRTFALGSDSISVMFLLSIASLMATGSIAVFSFSYNLQSVPLSIIGVSYSLAAFPILTQLYSKGETAKFLEQVTASARHVVFWTIPVATLFIVLRAQIVRTILGSGHFSWDDTRLTAAALALFAVSLLFQNLTMLFVRAYYAAGNTKKPFFAKAINAASTIALGFVFMVIFQKVPAFKDFLEGILRVSGIPGTVVLTLPLGWSVGELLNTVALWLIFQRDFKGFSLSVMKTIWQTLLSSLAMGAAAYYSLNILDNFFDINTVLGIFLQGLLAGLIGMAVGVIVLALLKNREADDVWQALHKKFWKRRRRTMVGPDPKVSA